MVCTIRPVEYVGFFFFFSSRRRHTRYIGDWSSDVCSSDLGAPGGTGARSAAARRASRTTAGYWRARGFRAAEASARAKGTAAAGCRSATRRSEERRVGKECRSRWTTNSEKKKRIERKRQRK